ncbi:MAG: hypothetical protein Q6370_020485, partial [Candidatus Sigynarchaeota archaeon]
MKSLAFSVPFCWPLLARLQKKQTIRLLFIPDYAPGEHLHIIARDAGVKPKRDLKLYIGQLTELFPIQLKDITPDIATRDGFSSVGDCQDKLAELNGVKAGRVDLRWGFVIRWEPVTKPSPETIAAVDRMYGEASKQKSNP